MRLRHRLPALAAGVILLAPSRILTAQGADATGGAHSYIENGLMRHGFGLVAFPVEYDKGGIMTFMVNQDGVVYEKDLGEDTAKIADAMKEYNPDKTWDKIN